MALNNATHTGIAVGAPNASDTAGGLAIQGNRAITTDGFHACTLYRLSIPQRYPLYDYANLNRSLVSAPMSSVYITTLTPQ